MFCISARASLVAAILLAAIVVTIRPAQGQRDVLSSADRRSRSPNVVQPDCAERQRMSLAELEKRHAATMQDIDRDERAGQGTWVYKGPSNEQARRQAERIRELSVANAKERAEEARAIEMREYECRKMAIEQMCTLRTVEINLRRSQCLQQALPARNRRNARVEDGAEKRNETPPAPVDTSTADTGGSSTCMPVTSRFEFEARRGPLPPSEDEFNRIFNQIYEENGSVKRMKRIADRGARSFDDAYFVLERSAIAFPNETIWTKRLEAVKKYRKEGIFLSLPYYKYADDLLHLMRTYYRKAALRVTSRERPNDRRVLADMSRMAAVLNAVYACGGSPAERQDNR